MLNIIYPKTNDTYFCGIATGYPPYQFSDKNGKPMGIDYEVAKKVFEKSGLKVNFVQKPWDDVLFSLMHNDGKIDILCGIEITDLRKKFLFFTSSYYKRNVVIFTLTKNNINSINDLFGKTITGDRHSYIEELMANNKSKIRIMQTKSKEESFLKLKSGEVIAVVAPLEVGNYLAKQMGLKIKILQEQDPGTPVAFAVNKSNKELLFKINQSLNELINDGTIDEILKKYK